MGWNVSCCVCLHSSTIHDDRKQGSTCIWIKWYWMICGCENVTEARMLILTSCEERMRMTTDNYAITVLALFFFTVGVQIFLDIHNVKDSWLRCTCVHVRFLTSLEELFDPAFLVASLKWAECWRVGHLHKLNSLSWSCMWWCPH